MSHIHLSLGNDLLRAEVRAHVACLASQLPNAEFNIVVTGAALAAILGNTGDLMVNAAPRAIPADIHDSSSAVRPAAASAAAADKPANEERFRRTKAETDAGLTVDEAKFFRQSGGGDPVAYKASLTKSDAAASVTTTTVDPGAVSPPPPPPPPPPSPPAPTQAGPASEQDVRDAAASAVKAGKKDDVLKIAADYGVKNWKELDPSKYGEALTKLTALMVVG